MRSSSPAGGPLHAGLSEADGNQTYGLTFDHSIFALSGRHRQVVDAGGPRAHQAVLIEFPVLIAAAAERVTAFVAPSQAKR